MTRRHGSSRQRSHEGRGFKRAHLWPCLLAALALSPVAATALAKDHGQDTGQAAPPGQAKKGGEGNPAGGNGNANGHSNGNASARANGNGNGNGDGNAGSVNKPADGGGSNPAAEAGKSGGGNSSDAHEQGDGEGNAGAGSNGGGSKTDDTPAAPAASSEGTSSGTSGANQNGNGNGNGSAAGGGNGGGSARGSGDEGRPAGTPRAGSPTPNSNPPSPPPPVAPLAGSPAASAPVAASPGAPAPAPPAPRVRHTLTHDLFGASASRRKTVVEIADADPPPLLPLDELTGVAAPAGDSRAGGDLAPRVRPASSSITAVRASGDGNPTLPFTGLSLLTLVLAGMAATVGGRRLQLVVADIPPPTAAAPTPALVEPAVAARAATAQPPRSELYLGAAVMLCAAFAATRRARTA
jgi:hypothetical protein